MMRKKNKKRKNYLIVLLSINFAKLQLGPCVLFSVYVFTYYSFKANVQFLTFSLKGEGVGEGSPLDLSSPILSKIVESELRKGYTSLQKLLVRSGFYVVPNCATN